MVNVLQVLPPLSTALLLFGDQPYFAVQLLPLVTDLLRLVGCVCVRLPDVMIMVSARK